jgi:protein-L-isoaspartate(D-aspartate) O-methyltransferase
MLQQDTAVNTQPYQYRLVEEIERHLSRPLVTSVREAFLSVPRDLFIERYYEQQGNSFSWDPVPSPSLEAIYRDESLVTKLDAHGRPVCSSSQPSIMAVQLEALDLQSGHRVQEIGAGTGYNAALMGHMVGRTGQVISIDIDEELVSTAKLHLSHAGVENVLAVDGDGSTGYPAGSPYDRLLATCGVKYIPRTWLYQLNQGGVLICNVLLNMASTFVRLEKISSTTLEGRLLDIDAQYMEMHGPGGLPLRRGINWKKYDLLPHHDVELPGNLTELLNTTLYSLLLQCVLPTVSRHYRWNIGIDQPDVYLLEHTSGGAAVRVQDERITVYGNGERLEEQIKESIALYKHLHSEVDYKIRITGEQATIKFDDQIFPFAILGLE